MVEFKNVNKNYGMFNALNDINLTINDGEIFGLVGKSGAGKSTLLRTINKLETIDSGEVIVNGININELKGKNLRNYRKKVAMIFQQFSLLETKTVYDNIALPLECLHLSKDEIREKVTDLAKIVSLEDKLNNLSTELSGGQKQRVAIARSLALSPEILLCDEATSALDPITTRQILELLKEINKNLGITIIIVTHQMEVVKEICQRIAIMKDGKILDIGNTKDLFLSNNEALKTIIDDIDVIPSINHNIKLYFGSTSKDAFITKMARNLDIDFSIVWGKLEKFEDDVLGTLVINVKDDDYKDVIAYLNNTNIKYEVLE